MERLEKDLHTQLEWVAVGYFNIERPHLQVALRGVGKDGEKVSSTADSRDTE